MTKEQFVLAAEGAGFQYDKEYGVFKHPHAPIYIWWLQPTSTSQAPAMRISWNLEYDMTYDLTLQRLTYLFKAFQK